MAMKISSVGHLINLLILSSFLCPVETAYKRALIVMNSEHVYSFYANEHVYSHKKQINNNDKK